MLFIENLYLILFFIALIYIVFLMEIYNNYVTLPFFSSNEVMIEIFFF